MNIEKWHKKLFLNDMRRAVEEFGMIPPGSRILIGISGGKDSITMGLGLEMLKRWLPTHFETLWVHLDYGAGGNPEPLKRWLAEQGVDLQVVPTDIWPAVEGRQGGSPCYMCAKLRRGVLARLMEAHGCNSIALGHHRDDALATLWMNLTHNGRFRTFQPVTVEAETRRTTIRPLIYCHESHIRQARDRFGFPQAPWQCPHEGATERSRTAALRERLREELPELDDQLMLALKHLNGDDRWQSAKSHNENAAESPVHPDGVSI